jgi:hypothetical protein
VIPNAIRPDMSDLIQLIGRLRRTEAFEGGEEGHLFWCFAFGLDCHVTIKYCTRNMRVRLPGQGLYELYTLPIH